MKNNNYSFFNVIKECLYMIAEVDDDKKCYEIIVKKINEFFKKNNSTSFSFKKSIREYAMNMLNIENQDILKIDLNDSVVDVKEHLDALKNTLQAIGENEKYDEEKIKKFLKQYSECSSNLIFNRDNYNLDLSLFRRCKLVKNLNELGVIPTNNKNISYCSIYNPNTAYAVVEIINEIIKNRKNLSIDPALREIRYDLFINSQKDRFERFLATNYGAENMNKVFFKDDINEVVSMPINNMSSFKAINPILLIDKIKSHILEIKNNKQNLKDNFLNLNICIVGSVENSTQMNNLLESIIGWYNRSFDNPKLNLNITSVINKDDPFQDVESINKNINGNVANFNVTKCNFIDLYLSTNNIINLLSENDITFLLNCPFLSMHASDTGRYALYEVYKYPVDLVSKHYTGLIFKDDTIKGTIRYMNDNYIRKLVSTLESDKDNLKKLYIYTPEKFHEIGKSYLDGFPISKNETHDSNDFLINKLSNKNETKLEYKELSNINIKVNLWSLFKYISTEYLFNNIKDIIVKNINRDLSFDQSMEIFNNIYFEINYT